MLAVDDSSYNLFVLQLLIEEMRIPDLVIKTALNGMQAVEAAKSEQSRFTHVLLDLHMPVMDGF